MKIDLNKACEKYSERFALRGAICAIPYVGGAIDFILATRGSSIIQNRIQTYIEVLTNQFNDLSEGVISKEYLDSEEFFDLIIKSFEIASKTRGSNKLKLLSSIVKRSVVKPVNNNMNEDLLYFIDNLNENDVIFMMFLNCNKPNSPKEKSLVSGYIASKLHEINPQESQEVYLFNLMKLEKLGLLHRNSRISANMENIPYNTTRYFQILLQYLKN
ncbi:MAG: hypothetical protein KAX28_07510 [Candidatus Marinimicrobia bacterium]|nr:hypothetical protein [Candidatus Neomarinimicrobiota bacterium]